METEAGVYRMDQLPDQLRIGACSWKYDSWKGLVYSEDVGTNHLFEYARTYKLVEVDQWFWALFGENLVMPKPEVVAEYAASVPKDFRFSIKVPNAITLTHPYAKGKKGVLVPNPHFLSNRLFDDFLMLLAPIADQIDSLIFQFEYLNKQKMPGQRFFQERLGDFFSRCPDGFRYCVETRNKNYLNKAYFGFLRDRGLTHVFLQGYWMPHIFPLYDRFADYIHGFSMIRLLGPDRKKIEKTTRKKWHQVVAPKDGELRRLAVMVRDMMSRGISVSLNVNNHYEGSAPITIDRFLDLYIRGTF